MTSLKAKKICICHYKVGKTDGVSLEIIKREKMLKQMGHQVILIAGTSGFCKKDKNNHTVFIIPELDFDYPKEHSVECPKFDIEKIKKNAFSGFDLHGNEKYKDEDALFHDIKEVADTIRDQFMEINAEENFDYLFLHNIFSHGRHIAAAMAFSEAIQKINIKVIAVNHDFYESYEDRYTPSLRFPNIKPYLSTYMPPRIKDIKHVTINSLTPAWLSKRIRQESFIFPESFKYKQNFRIAEEYHGKKALDELAKIIKRKSLIFPDTFEFEQNPWVNDHYNLELLKTFKIKDNDLVILQATRIVKRKAIELTVDLIADLNNRKDELVGKKLYNGKKLDENSKIILAFAQKEEQDSTQYKLDLIDRMNSKGVNYKFMESRIENERRITEDGKKIYKLWDAYVFADLVSYPSIWEGFGNQFLETVFAKKPIILFEYPVFKADIEKQGYKYISLGSEFKRDGDGFAIISKNKLEKATNETIRKLLDPQTVRILNKNFQVAKENFGEKTLKELLKKCLE